MDWTVRRYDRVDSTNTIALALAGEGAADWTVVVATEQGQGRGRLSRHFWSPPGGLYMSVLCKPALAPDKLPLMTLAAGVACAEAVEDVCDIAIALKWPNDLYIGHQKMGGILTETAPLFPKNSSSPAVVVGIGMNINSSRSIFPLELQESVTSLYDELNREWDVELIMRLVLARLQERVADLETGEDRVLQAWRTRDYLLDSDLIWQSPQEGAVPGKGAGLLADGRYQLRTAQGTMVPVLAGDLHLVNNETEN